MMEKFHWTSPSDVEITLPHMKNISAGILRKNRGANEMDLLFAVIEDASDEAMLSKIDALTLGDLEALVLAWTEEVSPGESSA